MKYSPLPWASPEITELLKSLPLRGRVVALVAAAAAAEMIVRDLTLAESRWRRRLKRVCGVELEDERESRWWSCKERVLVVEESESSGRVRALESSSGHERGWGVGRDWDWGWRDWNWRGIERTEERERKMKKRKGVSFPSICDFLII